METLPTDNVTAKAMPAVDTNIRGPFGSAVQGPIPDVPEPAFGSEVAAQDGPRVPGAAAFTDTGAGARADRAMREDPSILGSSILGSTLVSTGAAITTWDTTRLIKRLGRPTFDDDTPISQHEAFEQVDIVLTDDEREYVQKVGKGIKSFQWAMEQVHDRRMAASVMGDHEVVGIATGFIDPLWLVVPSSPALTPAPRARSGRAPARRAWAGRRCCRA